MRQIYNVSLTAFPVHHLDTLVYHSPQGRLLSVALDPAPGEWRDIIKWNGWNITNMIDTHHHLVLLTNTLLTFITVHLPLQS